MAPNAPAAPMSAPMASLKVAFIGAGGVNFGSIEGPWNHSLRLEGTLGSNLIVTAIIDPAASRRQAVLAGKRTSSAALSYQNTEEYDDVISFLKSFGEGDDSRKPDVVLIGIPPAFHGSTTAGRDIEIQLAKDLSKAALFVEKPMSSSPVEEVMRIGNYLREKQLLVSVGYFMRHLKVVQKMKEIIDKNQLTVMATVARYACSYAYIGKKDWWMKSISCAPIVEQGTHFCDLSRYFGGDVHIPSVQAHAVEHHEKPGALSEVPVDENSIPESDRIPRVTASVWKYASGAVGSLVHSINLQGNKYSCQLEVHADGWMLRLVDPYYNPTLYVRSPRDDNEEVFTFPGDDPYLTQMEALVDVVRTGQPDRILSSWEDAAKTYELTWAIRHASEASGTVKKRV